MKEQLAVLGQQIHGSGTRYEDAVREFKKQFVLTVLADSRGNQCRAARQLDMHRNTLSRILAELQIDVRQVRVASRRPPGSVGATAVTTGALAEKKTASH